MGSKTIRKYITKTVRRSIAISSKLVDDVLSVAEPGVTQNFNRVVTTALREYVERRHQKDFAKSMSEMAADPGIRKECAAIEREFSPADMDGLRSGSK